MAKFKPAKITTIGQQMMAQDLNNEIDLQFTRIVYGNGTYTESEYETITARTALKSQKQSIPINRKVRENNTSVSLIGVLSNLTLEEGYQMSEIGVYAKDSTDVNAEEKLYFIVIADTVDGVLCADYMPAYNGIAEVSIEQKFQVDIVDADETTITPPESVIVTQTYLAQYHYDKTAVDNKLAECAKLIVLDDCTTAAQVMAYATSNELNNSVNYTYAFHISGDALTEFGITTANALALLTFDGAGALLAFPFLHRFFHRAYSPGSDIYYWVEKHTKIDTSDDGEVATMVDNKLAECAKLIVLDDCTTAAQVMAYARSNELNKSINYTYAFNVSGDAGAEFGISSYSALVLMTFDGNAAILSFPRHNKTFSLGYNPITSQYYWVEHYPDVNLSDDGEVATMISARHPRPKHVTVSSSLSLATSDRNSAVNDQLANLSVGRLYINGPDFVEYVDLDSTANADFEGTGEPADYVMYIQTWHKTEGGIAQRTQLGANATPSAWAEISATTAT